MANIRLTHLLTEAEDFKARSKETGKLVHFKSKDSYQSAIKAGTHEDPKAKKDDKSKADVKPNDMFGGDYSKDRSGMETVNTIASKTGLRAQAVAGWADENGVNLAKVSDDLQSKKLNPMDLMTAVSGNSGNKYAKDIIAKYSQSSNDVGGDYTKDRVAKSTKKDKKGVLSTLGSILRSTIFGEPTDDAKPEDKKETQPTKDDEKPKKPKKPKKPRHIDSTRRTTWKREPGAPYAEDDKFWADRFLAGDKLAGQIATEEEFNMYRSAKIQASLTDWFKAKDKKDFNYKISEPSENGYVRISSEDGPVDIVMFSDDRNGTFNFAFVDNDGDEAEFTFGHNEVFGGWGGYDNPQYVYQAMRYIMAKPETIQLLRGEITTREYQPMYEKFKRELEPPKKENKISENVSSSTKLTSMIKK
jgi:hypothetical protein